MHAGWGQESSMGFMQSYRGNTNMIDKLRTFIHLSVFAAAIAVTGCGAGSTSGPTGGTSDNPSQSASSYTLTTSRAGSGTVNASSGQINCGSTCSDSYTSGTSVVLTATADTNYTFTGWSGSGVSCAGTGTCTVSMTADRAVTATFSQNGASSYTLTVNKTGSGTVTSNTGGINCGSTCSTSYTSGTPVTLTATPSANYIFTGWSGAGCSGTGSCAVTMSAARTVSATFAPSTYTLTVNKTGTGTVTSSPAGINCGSTCSASFSNGAIVALTAVAGTNYTFAGWGGACSGTGTCNVTVSTAQTVTATFNATASNYTLTVTKVGSGTVTSDTGAINCGSTCSASITANTSVVLTATPSGGYTFSGWSGGGCSGTGTCTVSMSTIRAVAATFVSSSGGITYYVAPSPTGNDSYNGTSLATPFATIGHAVSVVNQGDIIEVRAGTYTQAVMITRPGSSSGWITMRAYNGERAILRSTGSGPTLYFYHDNCDESQIGSGSGNTDCQAFYWILQGLEIQGSPSGGGDGNTVKIDVPKVKLVGNKLCCAVADIVKLVRTSNDVEILNNEIWQDSAVVQWSDNAQGVDIVGADRVRVAGNYVHDVPNIGIYAKGNSRDTIFENNRMVNIGDANNGHAIMMGQSTDFDRMVDGDYESYNGIVRNNVVVNATWSCVATASSQNVHIYNNSCYNTGTTVHGSILISNEAETNQAGTNIEIRNNIFYGSSSHPVINIKSDALTDPTSLHIDHNIYYTGPSQSPTFTWDLYGQDGIDFNAWQTLYQTHSGQTDSSQVTDPLYSNTSGLSTTPLTLQGASPAINTGVNTTYVPSDFLGTSRPQNGTTDIGAYEY
jgi:hypothetical protein